MYQKGRSYIFSDIAIEVYHNYCSSKQPVTFADDEETVLLYYGRSSLTGAVTEEKMFEFDRCSCVVLITIDGGVCLSSAPLPSLRVLEIRDFLVIQQGVVNSPGLYNELFTVVLEMAGCKNSTRPIRSTPTHSTCDQNP